jgi:hypothetical protein
MALTSDAKYTCQTLGAENLQGNIELRANWRIDETPRPVLRRVPGGRLRPTTQPGKQQVRAEVKTDGVMAFEKNPWGQTP